jgi:hypothetical protein
VYKIDPKHLSNSIEEIHLQFWLNAKNKNQRVVKVPTRSKYKEIHKLI